MRKGIFLCNDLQAFDKSRRPLYNSAVVVRPQCFSAGKGGDIVEKIRKLIKRIVEGVIARFIYDVLKHLFKDND